MGKNLSYRSLQLSWPRYGRRFTSIEWNGSCQCDVFNITKAKRKGTSKTRNKKHETKRSSTCAVYRLRHYETKKNVSRNVVLGIKQCLIREPCFHRNMCETKTNVYVSLYRQTVWLIIVSTMFCLPCALSRNSSLRDAKPAGHLFVWFAKHCLSFRGDADECEKQFRFVFRICLAFLTSVCAGLYGLFRLDATASIWRRNTRRVGFRTHVSQSEHLHRTRCVIIFIQ